MLIANRKPNNVYVCDKWVCVGGEGGDSSTERSNDLEQVERGK